jgi:hypothetical protein
MHEGDALKIENKVISQAATTGIACYSVSLHKFRWRELIEPSLIAACNEVLVQSAENEMKDLPLWKVAAERRISDMAENGDVQFIDEIKETELVALQLDGPTDNQNSRILLTHVRHIDHDEGDLEEDSLSVSELPTHTTSGDIFKVLSDSLKREISNGKSALEFVQSNSMHCYIIRETRATA